MSLPRLQDLGTSLLRLQDLGMSLLRLQDLGLESTFHILRLTVSGEIRIPQVLGSKTKPEDLGHEVSVHI